MTNKYTTIRFQVPSDSFTNVPGALAHFYLANTLTPFIVYSDSGLSVELPNPVVADGFGLFPDIFFAPISYDVVVTDADGVSLWDSDDNVAVDVPVLDPAYFSLINGEYVPGIAVNAQTGTTYTILNSDRATEITFNNASGGTITLPAPSGSNFPNKWFCYVCNIGVGTFTINSTANINGVGSYVLNSGSFTLLVSNGTTYSAGASSNNNEAFTKPGGTLTIATGVVTAGAFSQYIIDTEAAAASDDLDTINGGISGKLLVLRSANDARDVTLKNNTGNIYNPAGQDIVLGKTQDIVLLRYDSALSKWVVIAYQNANTAVYPSLSSRILAASVDFNGTGTVAINSSYNVSSITDNGIGDYTINFASTLANATYAILSSGAPVGTVQISVGLNVLTPTKTNSTCRIYVGAPTSAPQDSADVSVGFVTMV